MKQVERPAPVLVAVLDHDFYCFADATIRPDSRIPQIIEPSQNVVVPERREGEAQPAFVDDFAGSKRAEHAAFEQIIFASFPGARDGGRFAARSYASSPSSTQRVVWNEELRLSGRFGEGSTDSQFHPPSSSCSRRS